MVSLRSDWIGMRDVVVETDMIGIMAEECRSDEADRKRRIRINKAEAGVLTASVQVEESDCVM